MTESETEPPDHEDLRGKGLESEKRPEPFMQNYTSFDRDPDAEIILTPEGIIEPYIIELEDGMRYPVMIGTPTNQKTDIPIGMGTALATSVLGLNQDTQLRFMGLGFPVILIGAEGYVPPDKSKDPPKKPTLEYSALNMHTTFNAVADQGIFDTKKMIYYGESRGAMVGMGVLAHKKLFNREIIYANLIAPCFPEELNYSDTLGVVRLIGQAATEAVSAARGLYKRFRRSKAPIAATIDPKPGVLLSDINKIGVLKSGEAGVLAKLISTKQFATVTGFALDAMSQIDNWIKIFEKHQGVIVKPRPSAHLGGIIDQDTENEVRFSLLLEGLNEHGEISEEWLYFVSRASREELNLIRKAAITIEPAK
ncbi:hypothetical protein KBC31_04825 [Candidatus Saccharibacteria bacterium]|jgi:hypothetical protein|nr:hypothetical protein [Candidatus Saccharibacteria bacterium]